MKTILIADDHADIRCMVAMTLECEGFTLLQARNGAEALALAQRHRPDLVLLDVLMPGKLNGLVCHLIKTNDALAHTRVLMLSACGQPRDPRRRAARPVRTTSSSSPSARCTPSSA